MKKLKINNLSELLEAIKKSEYSFTRSPSINPTWRIIHEETKKVCFEYSKEDVYSDYELVGIDYFSEEERKPKPIWTLESLDELEKQILKLYHNTELSSLTMDDCMGKIDTERFNINQKDK